MNIVNSLKSYKSKCKVNININNEIELEQKNLS